jgi:hypothetical protein
LKTQVQNFPWKISRLAMNRMRRGVTEAENGMSRVERCEGARMKTPPFGSRSLPLTRTPNTARASATIIVRQNA